VSSIALTLGLLPVLLIVLLAVPLTVMFSIRRIEETQGQVRFLWLFGLVRFQLRFPGVAKACSRPAPAPAKKAISPRPGRKQVSAGRLFSLIWTPACRRRVHKFIRDMWRATHPRDLFLRLRIGLGDPADTGRLWAIVGPIAGMAGNLRSAEVRLEPEFIDPAFEVEGHGQFRLVPVQFIAMTVAFMLSPIMLRAWWRLYRGDA